MSKIAVLIFGCVLSSISYAEDVVPLELYMNKGDGGYITLTEEPCKIEKVRDKFPFYAYATDIDKEPSEGCWMKPNIEGMPKEGIPIVHIWHDGQVDTFMQSWFLPIKEETKTGGGI